LTPSAAGSINLGETAGLTFTVATQNALLTGISFTGPLPVGLAMATTDGLSGSCDGGTIAAAPASASLFVNHGCWVWFFHRILKAEMVSLASVSDLTIHCGPPIRKHYFF